MERGMCDAFDGWVRPAKSETKVRARHVLPRASCDGSGAVRAIARPICDPRTSEVRAAPAVKIKVSQAFGHARGHTGDNDDSRRTGQVAADRIPNERLPQPIAFGDRRPDMLVDELKLLDAVWTPEGERQAKVVHGEIL